MKVWKFLVFGLLACAALGYGQTTTPTPVVFKIDDILYPDTSDPRLMVKVPPHVRTELRRGKIVVGGVQADSVALDSLSKGQPRVWTLSVRTKTATAVIGVDRVTFRRNQSGYGTTGSWPDTTITVRHNEQVLDVFPYIDYTFHDADSMALNDTVRVWLLNKEFASATSDGKIDVNATLAVTSADTISIVTIDTVIVRQSEQDTLTAKITAEDTVVTSTIITRGDTITNRTSPLDTVVTSDIITRGDTITNRPSPLDTTIVRISGKDSIPVLPIYPIDTLTIASYDTSFSKADTETTAAFTGRMGYVTVFLDAVPVTSTGTIIGVGAQVKPKGSTLWYPGSIFSKNLIVNDSIAFHDSLYAIQLTLVPADSVRLSWWSMRPAMKAIMKRVHVLFRD